MDKSKQIERRIEKIKQALEHIKLNYSHTKQTN